jgi:hypothetical protein
VSNGIAQPSNGVLGRRKRGSSGVAEVGDAPPSKKRAGTPSKSGSGQNDEIIVVDDSGNGAIIIDDD